MTSDPQGSAHHNPPPVDADAFNAFEAAGWENHAPTYDQFIGPLTELFADRLLDAAEVDGRPLRVLDVATGPGHVAARAAERGAQVIGVDIAPSMVRLAQRQHPALDFRHADAEALPFDDGSFDAVVGNFLIPHLGRHELVLGELVRVLSPGGTLAMTTWDAPDRMRLLGVVLEAFGKAGAVAPDLPAGPPFFRFADDGQFRALLANSGLTQIRIDAIAFDHLVSSTDQLWNGMFSGTVRTSALLVGQPDETLSRIREALDRIVIDYRRGGRLELPVAAKLARGSKPSG